MLDMKNNYTASVVMNEFFEKVKELCCKYDAILAEAYPENIAIGLWDAEHRTTHHGYIHLSGKDGCITKDELSENGFAYKRSSKIAGEIIDYYSTYINGIEILCSMKSDSFPDEMDENE